MNLWHPLNRKLGGPRANISISREEINICPCQELILDSLAHSLYTVLTELQKWQTKEENYKGFPYNDNASQF